MAYYIMYERAGSISHLSWSWFSCYSFAGWSRADERLKYWGLAGISTQGLNHFKHLRIVGHSSLLLSVGESDIFCTCVSKNVSVSQVESPLQGVSGEVPLDRVLDWVGALEELFAGLLALRSLGGVQVLVQQLPEVIWHVEHLKVARHPEKQSV